MLEIAVTQGLFKLFLGLMGVLLGRATLMWMDNVIGEHNESSFSIWLHGAEDSAKAIYYAGRLIFVSIIIAAAIG